MPASSVTDSSTQAFLGIGKTIDNSSACLIQMNGNSPQIEIALSERLLRKKASGAWPEVALRCVLKQNQATSLHIAENREIISPALSDQRLNKSFPFSEYLKAEGLSPYSQLHNPEIVFVTHHHCHAVAAKKMSPFEKAVIVVLDGAGSLYSDFKYALPESRKELKKVAQQGLQSRLKPRKDGIEEMSVYLLNGGKLTSVYKRWQPAPLQRFAEGPGMFFEQVSKYIFNCKFSAGKVMGLAPLGKRKRLSSSRSQYLAGLDWSKAFSGNGKAAWENSPQLKNWANIAAVSQLSFEEELLGFLKKLRSALPDYDQLILAGGCALNCTANMKILESGIFDKVYVPPFPGDESIGFGAAHALFYNESPKSWMPMPHEAQQGYFGPLQNAPTKEKILKTFSEFEITKPRSIIDFSAELLAQGNILAWFQGRSESGPRALGNRSILANPKVAGLKNRLNESIKFREDFRPYGCSIPHEDADRYFKIEKGFESPFMAFAVKTRPQYWELLKEVTHVDGTSRIQTVRTGQNQKFHALLKKFAEKTDVLCLLNTSLNVMGEPIIETIEDAKALLESTPVTGLAIGDYYIKSKLKSPQR